MSLFKKSFFEHDDSDGKQQTQLVLWKNPILFLPLDIWHSGFLSKFQLSDIYLAGIITTVSQQEESHK